MKRNTILRIKFLIVLIFVSKVGISQRLDTNKIITRINKRYEEIINNKSKNIKIDTIYFTDQNLEEKMDTFPSIVIGRCILFHNNIDTFMIRRYDSQKKDEAYFSRVTEILLLNNKPIFLFEKSYASWEGIIGESKIYIHSDRIALKTKRTVNIEFDKVYNHDIYNISLGNVSSKIEDIHESDYKNVIRFLEYRKSEISQLTTN